ncbi:hypothetical protein OTU49_000851, partial [Cherax quadricarinatus]
RRHSLPLTGRVEPSPEDLTLTTSSGVTLVTHLTGDALSTSSGAPTLFSPKTPLRQEPPPLPFTLTSATVRNLSRQPPSGTSHVNHRQEPLTSTTVWTSHLLTTLLGALALPTPLGVFPFSSQLLTFRIF